MTHKKIRNVLEKAQIEGYSGACGEAAKAINRAFFDNEGKIAFAINRHVAPHEEYPFIGHVACKAPDGTLILTREELLTDALRIAAATASTNGPKECKGEIALTDHNDAETSSMIQACTSNRTHYLSLESKS